ncbi:organic cation transporter protein-like [Mytilus trossulus]|uniref:organic cation transporter protein-like n=1 Tax=Mytilus trossulus TaxID=6551 RepID=UPI003004E076
MVIIFRLVVSMGYYGLSLNTGNLSGDFYLNFFLSGLVEFPAYTLCLVLLDRVGRKKLHVCCFVGGGLACICTIFTMLYADESLQPITVTLAMIGKIGIAAAFAVIYVWSAEIYPTVVRNAGMGASSACARIGGMVSPYIADVSKVVDGHLGRALPLVIFGGFSVLAGLLSLLLPETLNHKLPETIQDGKEFGKKENKYFSSKSYSNQAFATDDNISTTKTESSRL